LKSAKITIEKEESGFNKKNDGFIVLITQHRGPVASKYSFSSAHSLPPNLYQCSLHADKYGFEDLDNPQILGSWTQVLLAAARAEGIETRELLDAVGLGPDEFADPNARHSTVVISALWRCAAEMSGNGCIGIDAVGYVNTTTFQALGYSVLASSTLREVFERYVQFGRFVSTNAYLQIKEEGEQTHLIYEMGRGSARLADEAIDAAIAQAVQTSRDLMGRWVHPVSVALRRPEPSPKQAFEDFFRAPIQFSAEMDALVFDSELLDRPLLSGNEILAKQTDEVVRKTLDNIGRKSQSKPVSERVRKWVIDQLPNGEPTQIAASQQIGMSLRSLQRHLSDEGGTFRDLVKQVRLDLSRNYLAEDRLSILEISALIGFNGSSSFSHAFRNWTGMAPTAFRRASHGKSPHLIGTRARST
jgi:AraC-like DNA-binding protein